MKFTETSRPIRRVRVFLGVLLLGMGVWSVVSFNELFGDRLSVSSPVLSTSQHRVWVRHSSHGLRITWTSTMPGPRNAIARDARVPRADPRYSRSMGDEYSIEVLPGIVFGSGVGGPSALWITMRTRSLNVDPVVLNLVGLFGGVYLLNTGLRWWTWAAYARRRRFRCRKCRYPLDYAEGVAACPECGTSVAQPEAGKASAAATPT